MAENAYPSPTQSLYTEDFQDLPSPSFTSDITRNLNAQNSLRQTSETLQATYRRLRQVRQSLMELTASLPSHSRQLEDTMSLMDPGHEAISLVDHDDDERRPTTTAAAASTSRSPVATTTLHELERLRPTLPPETYNRIRQFAMRYDSHAPSTPAPGTPALRAAPLPIPSPVTGVRSPLSPRNRPSLAERRSEHAFVLRRGDEEAQTTLGRRVTAREGSPGASGDRGTLPALRIMRTLSRTPDARPANIDGDALSPLEPRARTPGAASELYIRTRATQAGGSDQGASAGRQTPSGRQPGPQSRLSTLSGLGSVQNIASPSSLMLPPRPVLFAEPESMAESESVTVSNAERRAADVRASYLWDLATPQAPRPPRPVARTVRYDVDGNELREPSREPPVTRAPITPDSAHGDPRVRLGASRNLERNEQGDAWVLVDDDTSTAVNGGRAAAERAWAARPEWQSWREWQSAREWRDPLVRRERESEAPRKAPEPGPTTAGEPVLYGSSEPFEPDPLPMPLGEMVVYPAKTRRSPPRPRTVGIEASEAGR